MIPAIALLSGVIQLAPALAKVFSAGTKTSEVAEIAADVARAVTGIPDNEGALNALKASPELVLEYQKVILQKEADFEALYIEDKKDARLRDVEFLKAGTRNYRSDFLVGVSVVIILTILTIVTFKPDLDDYAKGVLTTILGLFITQLANVFSFEFGTTRKNEDKQTQLFNKENL